jgi:dihydroorotase
MSILIKGATIIDPASRYNGKKLDVMIEKGKIFAIDKKISEKAERTIQGSNIYVMPAWVDVMADYCDPGYEHKETITTGLNAAKAGGFGHVFITPNTQPTITTKSVLEYVLQKSNKHSVQLHVLGGITKNTEGKELAEMMDMHHAGAIAFSDGWKPVQNAALMLKALEYVKAFNGIIVQLPVYTSLADGGLMNEGETALRMGVSGMPNIAESLLVQRDIELVRYTGSRIHFSGITTPESLNLIRAAKKDGLDVTCSVTPYHLLFTEKAMEGYNSIFKVQPPLRTEDERKILVRALADGTIDCIATHHRPQDTDAKTIELEYAQWGMISQETCFGMLRAAAPKIGLARWVELLSINPRKIFSLQPFSIEEGQPAELTVIDASVNWVYSSKNKQSSGINTPFLNKELKGKIISIN